ncbi:hypothetical protein N7504_011398 [Penicillium tannophilum]|nr:hypothetical protein N7504_011398 [Penicillium tannophilum]
MPKTRNQDLSAKDTEKPDQTEDTSDVTPTDTPSTAEPNIDKQEDAAARKANDRLQRFKALQARAKSANERNLKETAAETADTEATGEDFERKRASDWTVDESERWDRRMEKKQRHRHNVAFQDYTQDANKVYKRQMRELPPNLEAYEKEKLAAIEKAPANGDLRFFYSTADSVGFTDNKPDRAAIDRLVGDIHKAEEVRLKKKRKERRDVTYINEKNKQFNQKLARFYNKGCYCYFRFYKSVLSDTFSHTRPRFGTVSSEEP